MSLPVVRKKSHRSRRFLVRGESVVAASGLLLAAIMLGAMGGSAWWSARSQRVAIETARDQEVRDVGELLSRLGASLLALDRISQTRLLTAETARRHGFTECRIVLPEGQVIAAARASGITLASLPERWSESPVDPAIVPPLSGELTLSYPLTIAGRGSARLDIAATGADYSGWNQWNAQAGIGIIGAAALFALLLVYRRMRSRLRAMSYIRESLLALDGGESAMAVLTVQNDLGSEAMAWNELIAERESLQQVLVTKRLLELPSARQDRSHDLTSMCDAMSQGLILVDRHLLITYANGAAGLYIGTTREQVLGTSIDSTLDHPELLAAVRGVAEGTVRRSAAIETESEAGDTKTVLRFIVRPVRREDESAAMIVIEDVTQQRLADDARNSFVANVTHELRTPLTNILIYAEQAMDDDADRQTWAQALNVINGEAKRLNRIVGDMLSVSEIEAGTHQVRLDDVPLITLFDELRADYEAAAREKGIALEINLPPKLPTIQADRDKIALAVHNLVGNALKYTPTGGRISVEVECEADVIEVRVVDTGIGMTAEDRDRAFERFYRARDERIADVTGTGLGLALAREVVRLHGGDITVESELNKGSTFTLTVPVMATAA